ncbi:MAG: FmdB family zinc ribbon protein [Vicinamibacterales bacterium]
MPLYEYQCEKCGHRFEKIQRLSDPPPEACPVCGGAVHKMQSAPAFQFKGSGWYITDYARKDQPGGGAAKVPDAKSGDDKSGSKDATSTESKETTKTDKSTASTDSTSAGTAPKAS